MDTHSGCGIVDTLILITRLVTPHIYQNGLSWPLLYVCRFMQPYAALELLSHLIRYLGRLRKYALRSTRLRTVVRKLWCQRSLS